MAKEQVVEEVQVEETSVEQRLVNMTDGTVVDFGARANVLVHTDQEAKVITFLLSNGHKIVWEISDLSSFTPFQVQVYLYGLAAKVKSSLAPLKDLTEIEVAIEKQITAINSGIFILRSGKEAKLELSDLQKAYAIVKSNSEGYAAWANVEDTDVIKAVLAHWETFDKSTKNGIRKNAYVQLELSKLAIAAASDVELA